MATAAGTRPGGAGRPTSPPKGGPPSRDRLRADSEAEYADEPLTGPATKSDVRQLRARAAANDRPPEGEATAVRAPAATPPPRRARATTTSSRSRSSVRAPWGGRLPSGRAVAGQAASLGVGLVAYALILAYLDYGWPGVGSWLSAKFANNPTLGGSSSSTSSSGSSGSAGGSSSGISPITQTIINSGVSP